MDATEIKKIRKLLGMSQERLARELGVSFCTVNRWERGRTEPSPMAMEKLLALKSRIDSGRAENNRTSVRMPVSFPLMVEPLSGHSTDMSSPAFTVSSADIGLGGLKFSTDRDIQPGDKLRIYIDIPQGDYPVKVVSDVKWKSDSAGSRDVGVHFSDIRAADLEKMKNAMLTVLPAHA